VKGYGEILNTPDLANNRFLGLKKFEEQVLAKQSNPSLLMGLVDSYCQFCFASVFIYSDLHWQLLGW